MSGGVRVGPILFSSPMIRALLEGRKTQTRRIIKPQPFPVRGPFYRPYPTTSPREWHSVSRDGYIANIQVVRYEPGQLLWVRENMRVGNETLVFDDGASVPKGSFAWQDWMYRYGRKKIPSIHMPRWASRITLEVTAVKVERLQDISKEDAQAEGCGLYVPGHGFITESELSCDPGYSNFLSPRMGFEAIWTEIHGPASWDANPWIVAVSFTPHLRNIDQLIAARAA
jgi:hypothetical protein